jgi:hypothetical protein
MGKYIDLVGQKFGRLRVIKDCGRNKEGQVVWKCLCDCGETTQVVGASLRGGDSISCGCLKRELISKAKTTHGHSKNRKGKPASRTYNSWFAMKKRCLDPNYSEFYYYGGRGVSVYPEWLNFENFLSDMGERPPKRTLDRINPFGNYEPGNCRWATGHEQRINRRSNYQTIQAQP